MSKLKTFGNRDALTEAAACHVATSLRQAVDARGAASFVASGGGTPGPVYDQLSRDGDIPWRHVAVLLSDERHAEKDTGHLNEDMLRNRLLVGEGEAARYVPLEEGMLDASVPRPFDMVLLGMGGDGHFASVFPAGEGMEAALAEDAPDVVATTPEPLPPEAPHPRITLSLGALRQSRAICLLVAGDQKKAILDRAMTEGTDLPIDRLLSDATLPLQIFWSP